MRAMRFCSTNTLTALERLFTTNYNSSLELWARKGLCNEIKQLVKTCKKLYFLIFVAIAYIEYPLPPMAHASPLPYAAFVLLHGFIVDYS